MLVKKIVSSSLHIGAIVSHSTVATRKLSSKGSFPRGKVIMLMAMVPRLMLLIIVQHNNNGSCTSDSIISFVRRG